MSDIDQIFKTKPDCESGGCECTEEKTVGPIIDDIKDIILEKPLGGSNDLNRSISSSATSSHQNQTHENQLRETTQECLQQSEEEKTVRPVTENFEIDREGLKKTTIQKDEQQVKETIRQSIIPSSSTTLDTSKVNDDEKLTIKNSSYVSLESTSSQEEPNSNIDKESEKENLRGKKFSRPVLSSSLKETKTQVPKAFVQAPVRKKDERRLLDGNICIECKKFYSTFDLSEEQLREKLRVCSRHKATPRPKTPDHFWEFDFPSEEECKRRGYM